MARPLDCPPSPAAAFAWVIPHLQSVGRDLGYAIGVHGSLARDLDLIAVPWTESATDADTLVEAIRDAVGGFIRNDSPPDPYDQSTKNPNDKPHGRRAWSIYFSGRRFYIDLSVTPRLTAAKAVNTQGSEAQEGGDQ